MYREASSTLAAIPGWAGFFAAPDRVTLAVVCLVLAVLAGVLFWVLLMARRRVSRDVREVVLDLEELRAGNAPDRYGAIDAGSPLVLVRDAVQRLGQDVAARMRSADEAEQKLRAMGDAAIDSALVQTDVDGDIVEFSAGAVALLGWSREEALGRPSSMLFEEQAYKDFLPKLLRRSIREQGLDTRSVMSHREGERFPCELHVHGVRGGGGEANGFLFVIRDASERARLETELRDAERRYRSLVEGLGEGVLIARSGQVLYANPAMGRLAELPVDKLIGSALRHRLATRDLLNVEERLAALEAGAGEPFEVHARLATDAGSPGRQVRIDARGVDYAGARAVLLVARDETFELRTQRELKRNEAHLDAVLEATSDGIMVFADDGDGPVARMTNRAFLELFGLQEGEVLGRREGALYRILREHGGGAAGLARLLEGAGEGPYAEPLTLGGSRRRELIVRVDALTDSTGRVWGRVVACRDRTESVEAERKLQQFAEQLQLKQVLLEHAYRRLQEEHDESDRLNAELRKLDEMKSNLLGNVSHELQAPLVSIRGYTELLKMERFGPLADQQREVLELSLNNIDRLIGLIDNLLAFTRGDPDERALDLEEFDLADLVTEIEVLLHESFGDKGMRVSIDVPSFRVHADRGRIGQVLINLLTNAVKFTEAGGEIAVHAQPATRGFVQVEVRDTGIGIPETLRERVFERGFQVERARSADESGSGFGLSIVRDILRLHGCRVAVESEPGKGSRFYFTLPAAGEIVGATEETPGAPEAPPPEAVDDPAAEPERASEPETDANTAEEAETGAETGKATGAQAHGDAEAIDAVVDAVLDSSGVAFGAFEAPGPEAEPDAGELAADTPSDAPESTAAPAAEPATSPDDGPPDPPRPRFRIIRR